MGFWNNCAWEKDQLITFIKLQERFYTSFFHFRQLEMPEPAVCEVKERRVCMSFLWFLSDLKSWHLSTDSPINFLCNDCRSVHHKTNSLELHPESGSHMWLHYPSIVKANWKGRLLETWWYDGALTNHESKTHFKRSATSISPVQLLCKRLRNKVKSTDSMQNKKETCKCGGMTVIFVTALCPQSEKTLWVTSCKGDKFICAEWDALLLHQKP